MDRTRGLTEHSRGRTRDCISRSSASRFWRRGEPQVWATAAALAGMLFLVFVLLAVVLVNGLGVFWPSRVAEVTLTDGRKILGQRIRSQINPDTRQWSVQFKTGNRERDPQRQDFIGSRRTPSARRPIRPTSASWSGWKTATSTAG